MKTFIALAASFAVNLAILGTLEWSAYQAQTPPTGEVFVTEVSDSAQLLAYRGRAAQALL